MSTSASSRFLSRFTANPLAVAGAILLFLLILGALLAPLLPLPDPNATDLAGRLRAPGTDGHLVGTDLLGRDILSRLLHGTRTSLVVAFSAALAAALIGSGIGLVAGYFGGRWDAFLMRGIDTLMAFPYLLLALAIVAILGPGLINALIAIAIVNIPFFARTIRGTTIGLVRRDFVDTARMSGRSEMGILFGEVFPNVLPVIIITLATTSGWMILETAGLSFLGLGAQPPTADLGSMLGESRQLLLIKPHLALLPGLMVFLLVIGINLVGDGLRDALDPRMTGKAAGAPGASTPVAVTETNSSDEKKEGPLLQVENLSVDFVVKESTIQAVRNVSFSISRSGTLGVVGESGSGKSVSALSILRLVASANARISSGRVLFEGRDLLRVSPRELRTVRGNRIACIFQDPLTSLNPLLTVGDQIAETILLHRSCSRKEALASARDWMERLQIPAAKDRLQSYPHELSGGMRQRIGLAMAMVNEPELIIADEPTTALDVTVQRTVLELLLETVRDSGTALLFISHDISLVSEICQEIVVLYAGEVVEQGPTGQVLGDPAHPYTRGLLACLPGLQGPDGEFHPIPGTPPEPGNIPHGCAFAPRCQWTQDACRAHPITLEKRAGTEQQVRCIRSSEILEQIQKEGRV